MKNSFVIYTDYYEHVDLLSMEQRGLLFTGIMCYASGREMPDMDGMTKMAFSFIKSQMDRDATRYEKTVEARSQAGKKGGRPKKEANAFSEKQTKAKKANVFSEKQTKAKKADNDTVTDNDTENENENGKDKTICAEPDGLASAPVVGIILNDGSVYEVAEKEYAYYCSLYPAVDVMQELRKMVGWCDSNPANRKTRRGIKRFINSWLSRAQDRAPQKGRKKSFYEEMGEWVNDRRGVCNDSFGD